MSFHFAGPGHEFVISFHAFMQTDTVAVAHFLLSHAGMVLVDVAAGCSVVATCEHISDTYAPSCVTRQGSDGFVAASFAKARRFYDSYQYELVLPFIMLQRIILFEN